MDTTNFEPGTNELLPTPVTPKAKAQRRRFTPSFRQQVIDEVLAGNESVSVIARRYDLNANLVFKWKRNYQHQRSGTEAIPTLLPVHVAASSQSACADSAQDTTGRIDITLRGGKAVTIHGEVSMPALRTVLEMLR